jgi:hypothetical protein
MMIVDKVAVEFNRPQRHRGAKKERFLHRSFGVRD